MAPSYWHLEIRACRPVMALPGIARCLSGAAEGLGLDGALHRFSRCVPSLSPPGGHQRRSGSYPHSDCWAMRLSRDGGGGMFLELRRHRRGAWVCWRTAVADYRLSVNCLRTVTRGLPFGVKVPFAAAQTVGGSILAQFAYWAPRASDTANAADTPRPPSAGLAAGSSPPFFRASEGVRAPLPNRLSLPGVPFPHANVGAAFDDRGRGRYDLRRSTSGRRSSIGRAHHL